MPIKAITIDFWNTLFDSTNGQERQQARITQVAALLHERNFIHSNEELEQAHTATWQNFNGIWKTERRTIPARESAEFFFKTLHIQSDAQMLDATTRIFEEGILYHPPRLLPEAKEVLAVLSQNFHIALISDTAFSPGRILRQLMLQEGVADFFHAYSFSDETGVSKPHPTAFRQALDGTGILPHECVHIGDIERTDVVGAKNFGMKAIRFDGDYNPAVSQTKDSATIADATADSWREVYDIIHQFHTSA